MGTVTKKELAYRIAERTGQRKVVVKRVIQEFLGAIIDELAAGNRLEFREFGVFEIKRRAARQARNPRSGDKVQVPSKFVVHFKAGRALKDQVQAGLAAAEAARKTAQAKSDSPIRRALTPPAAREREAREG